MFKNKSSSGKNNICGEKIYALRKAHIPKMSQRILAEKLQIKGIDVDKNAIQRIESGERFVTDIELKALAEVFNTTVDSLLTT
ncbi:MAG: helix-turn-helix transcriptional regulator [Clostridia bacterium]|nr:helix-turn-helix transcriptional regulator [Clostridia bacterium]